MKPDFFPQRPAATPTGYAYEKIKKIAIIVVVLALLAGGVYYFSTTETAKQYAAKV